MLVYLDRITNAAQLVIIACCRFAVWDVEFHMICLLVPHLSLNALWLGSKETGIAWLIINLVALRINWIGRKSIHHNLWCVQARRRVGCIRSPWWLVLYPTATCR